MAGIKAALVPFQFEGRCNVGKTERWLTGIAGAALAGYGVSRAVATVRRQRAGAQEMAAADTTGDASDSMGALSAQLPGTAGVTVKPAGEAPSVPADLSEQEKARAAGRSDEMQTPSAKGESTKVAGLLMLAGGSLVARAASGFCPMYAVLGRGSHDADWEPRTDTASRRTLSGNRGFRVDESITIERPISDVYAFWRNFENLPHFMNHVQSVRRLDDRRSHWQVRGPMGATVEWDAEIVNEEPNKVIGWRTLAGADVVSAGSVQFEPEPGSMTRLKVRMQYQPPAGTVGATIAKLLEEDPSRAIREDLARLKTVLEARDVPKAAGR